MVFFLFLEFAIIMPKPNISEITKLQSLVQYQLKYFLILAEIYCDLGHYYHILYFVVCMRTKSTGGLCSLVDKNVFFKT